MPKDKLLRSEELGEYVTNMFATNMPFIDLLGMKMIYQGTERAEVHLPWKDNLMGNPIQKVLHGGVTAAILDTVGGLMAILHAVAEMDNVTLEEFHHRVGKMSTIDMRIDYLRPGKGEKFIATAEVIRKGSRVAVCRMELHNESGTHIAFGTGTYMIA
nr:thioesterase family protein [Paraneptunicella aestuarii]